MTNDEHRAKILKHLKRYETITQREALMFGCNRLIERIAELRAEGHDILTELDKKTGHAVYRLVPVLPPVAGPEPEHQPSLFG